MASKYQKRHYEDVARVLTVAYERVNYTEGLVMEKMPRVREHIQFIADDFAALFGADNPLFDRERFFKACGLDA